MKPKPTTSAEDTPVRVLVLTMDTHLASAVERATLRLARELPGLVLRLHAASEWAHDEAALARCRADIAVVI